MVVFLEPVTLGDMIGTKSMEGKQKLLEILYGVVRGESNTLVSLFLPPSSVIPVPPIAEQSRKQQGGLGNVDGWC